MFSSRIIFSVLFLCINHFVLVGKRDSGPFTVYDISTDSGNLVNWEEIFCKNPNFAAIHKQTLLFCGVCYRCSLPEPCVVLNLELIDFDKKAFLKSLFRLKDNLNKCSSIEKILYLLLEIKNKDPLFQARYKRSQCCKLVKENCLFIEKGVGTKNNNLFDLWLQLAEELFSLSQSSRLEEYKFLSVSIFKSLFYFLHKEGFFLEENDFQKAVKFIFFKDSCIGFFKLGLPFELMDEIISYMNVDSYDLDFCQEFFGVEFSLRKA